MLALSALVLPVVTGFDDPDFVDSYGWTCRDYDRATEQCKMAHTYANDDGFHAGNKCSACRRRVEELLSPGFIDEVMDVIDRRRQLNTGTCMAQCSTGASGCQIQCDEDRNNCRDKCTSVERTCQDQCAALNANIDAIVMDTTEDPETEWEEAGGMAWWAIVLILLFVLLCCCIGAAAFYFYVLPSIMPKRVVAGNSRPQTPVQLPSGGPRRQSCDVPMDDAVPMLSPAYEPRGPPGMQRLAPPMAQTSACGPGPEPRVQYMPAYGY